MQVVGLSVNLLTESAAVRLRPGAAGVAIDGAELAKQFADTLTAKVLAWQRGVCDLSGGAAMQCLRSRSTCASSYADRWQSPVDLVAAGMCICISGDLPLTSDANTAAS